MYYGNFIDKRGLVFTISTDAAREEERFLGADSETVRQLLDEISIKNNWNAEIAKAFFELLQNRIETASNRLIAEAVAQNPDLAKLLP